MFAYFNVTRLIFYAILGYAVWIEAIPWWIFAAWIAYDHNFYILVKVPFTKTTVQNKPFNWADYKGQK